MEDGETLGRGAFTSLYVRHAAEPSLPGKANILLQCAHGPCQRYISVHINKAWCFECEGTEIHAPFLVHEDERKHARCPVGLLETCLLYTSDAADE